VSPVTTTLPEPTHAEVIRRLDAIATDLKSLNDRLDSTYVRRDVHEEVHRNTETALAAKPTVTSSTRSRARSRRCETSGNVSSSRSSPRCSALVARSHGPSCSDSPAADVGGLRARLADLARRWDAEAASAGRVSRSLDGLASAAGAAGRARTCREHAEELRRALNATEED